MLGKMETYWIYGHTINLIVLKVREIKYKKSYHEHIRLIKLDIKNWWNKDMENAMLTKVFHT
jgi:hypothetical protein